MNKNFDLTSEWNQVTKEFTLKLTKIVEFIPDEYQQTTVFEGEEKVKYLKMLVELLQKDLEQ